MDKVKTQIIAIVIVLVIVLSTLLYSVLTLDGDDNPNSSEAEEKVITVYPSNDITGEIFSFEISKESDENPYMFKYVFRCAGDIINNMPVTYQTYLFFEIVCVGDRYHDSFNMGEVPSETTINFDEIITTQEYYDDDPYKPRINTTDYWVYYRFEGHEVVVTTSAIPEPSFEVNMDIFICKEWPENRADGKVTVGWEIVNNADIGGSCVLRYQVFDGVSWHDYRREYGWVDGLSDDLNYVELFFDDMNDSEVKLEYWLIVLW